METIYFLGIDMAKKNFQAALTVDGVEMVESSVENTPDAIKCYFKELSRKFSLSQLIVCVEHTGIYTHSLLDHLIKHKIKVCVESSVQIKRSQGVKRGKSDRIDARRIAQYALKNAKELRLWSPARKVIEKIKSLLVTRERLITVKGQLSVALKEQGCGARDIQKLQEKACKKTIEASAADIAQIDREIKLLIKSDPQLEEQCTYATSVPGVGQIIALNMIICTGEFGQITESKKFACYAGVAPFEHSSGSSIRGKTRISKMANMTMKRLLHMGALSAITCSDDLRAFYDRKVAEGKNKMSVLNAVRNKLISRVFACVKKKHLYEKSYQRPLFKP